STKLILIISAIFALISLSACGEEPNKKPNVIINNTQGDTGNQDVGHNDTGHTDTDNQDVDENNDTQENDIEDQDTDPGNDADTGNDNDTDLPDNSCGDRCIASEICVAGECVTDTAD